MDIFLGAAHVACALGKGVAPVLQSMMKGESGLVPVVLPGGGSAFAGRAFTGSAERSLENELVKCAELCVANANIDVARTGVILSTTKGEIGMLEKGRPEEALLPLLAKRFAERTGLALPIVVSNACASGTLAIKLAADLISAGRYDHVLVLGGDLVSEFTLSGFAALHALSPGPCRPFDRTRDGVSLGEAVAGLVLTNDRSVLNDVMGRYLGGGMGNDANHISGPSRTGEGLVRAVEAALRQSGIDRSAIGHINAHGTGSDYNDRMEAVAFGRVGIEGVPTNSHKGYFGHTLGAAGVLETALALEAVRRKELPASLGAHDLNELPPLNVLQRSGAPASNILLKTSSGFGGCNAAILIEAC
ncbi:MAG: beta-ketoacyl synthase [Flavobacteriales bacterium]|nr:MAG: beta-ketoacyl synthase [Flavobacteriales bacterium]